MALIHGYRDVAAMRAQLDKIIASNESATMSMAWGAKPTSRAHRLNLKTPTLGRRIPYRCEY
jgi:hypothetical protein